MTLTDPVNGTTADATVIATNNANIKSVVNGGIEDSNISASAAISISKLSGYPGDGTKFLAGDSTWVAPSSTPGSELADEKISASSPTIATTSISEATAGLVIRSGLKGTVTVTIASPAVFSFTAHGLVANDVVTFETTGALPTGLTVGTPYYVIAAGLTADAFEVSATLAGSALNTSGTQSGTHSLYKAVTYDGSKVKVVFSYPQFHALTGTANVTWVVFCDATVVGWVKGDSSSSASGPGSDFTVYDTPTAAKHTYAVKAFQAAATSFKLDGDVGGSGKLVPIELRITKA